jgi:hypothetical protein
VSVELQYLGRRLRGSRLSVALERSGLRQQSLYLDDTARALEAACAITFVA